MKKAPCDIDCETCEIYLATKENNLEKTLAAGRKYIPDFEGEPWCDGCLENKRLWQHCKECEIRKKHLEK